MSIAQVWMEMRSRVAGIWITWRGERTSTCLTWSSWWSHPTAWTPSPRADARERWTQTTASREERVDDTADRLQRQRDASTFSLWLYVHLRFSPNSETRRRVAAFAGCTSTSAVTWTGSGSTSPAATTPTTARGRALTWGARTRRTAR